jgi:hypothetical protein
MNYSPEGNLSWVKTYGGINSDWSTSLIQNSDDSYMLVGGTSSYGLGNSDMLIGRIKSDGSIDNCPTTTCQSQNNIATPLTINLTTPSVSMSSISPIITTPTPTVTNSNFSFTKIL